ncbi:hypothetical protein ACYG9R_29715 [Mesorhizobium sp. RSR565B]|uniref:hypothetical protein n=1 Tax=unclassified Mesorhizobium TaxID=325217 RepID=UPI0012DDBD0B|nr:MULTISPECIES: hypothetical protein [unclassified Mesorhizobium]
MAKAPDMKTPPADIAGGAGTNEPEFYWAGPFRRANSLPRCVVQERRRLAMANEKTNMTPRWSRKRGAVKILALAQPPS